MFVDTAKIYVRAGNGGNGVVNFRHEKFVDRGGPDGGNGGGGGNVIFVADPNLDTLIDFRFQPRLIASNGENGSKQRQNGKSGADLIVKVPVGTIIRKSSKPVPEDFLIADLSVPCQEAIIARGGKGGFGNAHFKSSVRQTPRIAERGEQGEKFELILELKLLADVGLVGFPNAGKSTFLSVVTSARPEIADYPFTTLTPNLGVTDFDGSSLLIADIPGLIEGAAEGKGLGHDFLRHVERTSVILHLIDVLSDDVVDKYQKIRAELEKYSPELAKKPEVVAITKIDAVDSEIVDMQIAELKKITQSPILSLSSVAHTNLTEVLRVLKKSVDKAKKSTIKKGTTSDDAAIPIISLSDKQTNEYWEVTKVLKRKSDEIKYFVVQGPKIEKFSSRTDFDNVHGVNRLRDIMKKTGITHELIRQGATGDSPIRIGDDEFTLLEQ